jgi:hypothetical protein
MQKDHQNPIRVTDSLSNFAGNFSKELLHAILHPSNSNSLNKNTSIQILTTKSAGECGNKGEISATATNPQFHTLLDTPAVPLRKKSKTKEVDLIQMTMEYIYFGPGPAKLPKEVSDFLHSFHAKKYDTFINAKVYVCI